jgi:hypothetical protein
LAQNKQLEQTIPRQDRALFWCLHNPLMGAVLRLLRLAA